MICLAFRQCRFQVIALILYTCIWLPMIRLKHALAEIAATAFGRAPAAAGFLLPAVPVARFSEVMPKVEAEAPCSICLTEFEGAEEVSRLPLCGHVFHVNCIARWLERDRFTCPLCRSPVLVSGQLSSLCGFSPFACHHH